MKENLMQRKRRYLLTPKKELAERCLLIEQELNKLHSIIKELDNYIESDEFNNTFHCCEERNKVKKDIIKILKGSDKE